VRKVTEPASQTGDLAGIGGVPPQVQLWCRDWEGALEAIDLCRSRENNFGLAGLFGLYQTRIQAFRKSPPPADWMGVFVFATRCNSRPIALRWQVESDLKVSLRNFNDVTR